MLGTTGFTKIADVVSLNVNYVTVIGDTESSKLSGGTKNIKMTTEIVIKPLLHFHLVF